MQRYHLEISNREVVVDVQELAADRFEVLVGGDRYTVRLKGDEDAAGLAITPVHGTTAALTAATPAPTAPAAETPAPRTAVGGKATLKAPMPGVILEIHVKPGDAVTRGQPVAILDAMKMHNVIGAPHDGTIAEVLVSAGQNVNHGDALIRYAAE